jgi:hypothetical protein
MSQWNPFITCLRFILYEAWYHQDSVKRSNVEDGTVVRAIKELHCAYIDILCCQNGHGCKLTKIHTQLHIPYSLSGFGSNQNFNGGPCNCNHKEIIKQNTKHT